MAGYRGTGRAWQPFKRALRCIAYFVVKSPLIYRGFASPLELRHRRPRSCKVRDHSAMLSLLRPFYHATECHSYHLRIFRDNDYLLPFILAPNFSLNFVPSLPPFHSHPVPFGTGRYRKGTPNYSVSELSIVIGCGSLSRWF